MRNNRDELKVHIIDVNHGDATILEFPDCEHTGAARFGVVDFGAKLPSDRGLTTAYMQALIDLRRDNDPNFDYTIDFACVTHPHDDHYGGLKQFMDVFTDPALVGRNRVGALWDCGFRTNSLTYNRVLKDILDNRAVTFTRLGAGSEFEFGQVRITVLAPSVDLRNRFDTYGVGKNDASVVIKVKYKDSYVILAADAEFASWGKTTEEFPRRERISFFRDALGLSERDETSDQLKCNLLRVSHHGSKHGTSLEYLERLKPNRVVISCADDPWYRQHKPDWVGKFPHELTEKTLEILGETLGRVIDIRSTAADGNMIFKYGGGWSPRNVASFPERADEAGFDAALAAKW
jgi:beta-lactamase superfamily II metal-dependent hydrolase